MPVVLGSHPFTRDGRLDDFSGKSEIPIRNSTRFLPSELIQCERFSSHAFMNPSDLNVIARSRLGKPQLLFWHVTRRGRAAHTHLPFPSILSGFSEGALGEHCLADMSSSVNPSASH